MQLVALVGVILSAAGAAVPRYLFPICAHAEGAGPPVMRCFASGRIVELAMLASMFAWGLVLVRSSRPRPRARALFLALVSALLTVAASAVTAWPGLCDDPSMPCVTGTRPAVLVAVALGLAALATAVVKLRRERSIA